MHMPKSSCSSYPHRLQGYRTPRPRKGPSQDRSYQELRPPHSYLVKTLKGVLRWNRIQIKEVPLPVNPTAPTIQSTRPPHTTDVLRIAAKPSCLQSTAQPRVAAKSPSIKHTSSAGNTNQQELSNPRSTQDVQISVLQQHSMLSDRPIMSPGSDDNKASPKVSVPKPPDLVQKDTNNLRRSCRESKLNRKYIKIR